MTEPTEAEWAAIGRYLCERMQCHSLTMDGVASYRLRGGWPELRERSAALAVLRAIRIERDDRKRKERERE